MDHIASNQSEDDNFHAVVHTETSYLSTDTLVKEFVSTIKLGDPYTHTYTVNVAVLKDSLNLSLNWGGEGNKYFVRLPYQHRGKYFSHQNLFPYLSLQLMFKSFLVCFNSLFHLSHRGSHNFSFFVQT